MVDVAGDAAAAALYVSNIRFAAQATDYLQAELDPSPLLHFWSLGVEEQFYLFWPALLFAVAGRRTSVRRIGIAIAVVAAVSLVLSIVWTSTDAPLAFFLLPARAWELAIGAGLALAATRIARIPALAATAAVVVGLALIVIGAVVFDLATPFPGTAALRAGGRRRPGDRGRSAPAARADLAARGDRDRCAGSAASPIRCTCGTGRLLVLPAAAVGAPLPGPVRLALVGLTFVLAEASRRWVEDPIRHGRISTLRPSRSLAAAGAISLVVAGFSLGAGRLAAPPQLAAANGGPVELDLPTPLPDPSGASRATPSAGATQTPGCDTDARHRSDPGPDGCRSRPGRPRAVAGRRA